MPSDEERHAILWLQDRADSCEKLSKDPLLSLKRSDEFGYEARQLRTIQKMLKRLEDENHR